MKTLMITGAIVAGIALGAPAMAQTKPVISVIVKDTTSPYWQAVLAGARKAGQELGATVVELGAVLVVYAILVSGLIYRELPLREMPKILLQVGLDAANIMFIVGASSLLAYLASPRRGRQR